MDLMYEEDVGMDSRSQDLLALDQGRSQALKILTYYWQVDGWIEGRAGRAPSSVEERQVVEVQLVIGSVVVRREVAFGGRHIASTVVETDRWVLHALVRMAFAYGRTSLRR